VDQLMSETGVGTIQEEFTKRCDELLRTMIDQAREQDTWDIYLAKGAGDRAIAGDHEERHLLELLQNARDAIYRGHSEGDASPGRVLVAVTERGMAMANTGAPFQLNDEDVLKAVRFLMRSDKAGSRGFIGYKGIGLKSILLRAGAFSVRSRIDGEVLLATFSRHRTAAYLLDKMHEASGDFPNQQHVLEELPRMPLFTQPHPDSADQDALGTDTPLVEALLGKNGDCVLGLDDQGSPSSLEPYTTVVYLPYRDEAWEKLLDRVEKKLKSGSRKVFRQARRQMGTTSKQAGADALWQELTKLDPRVHVLLGEVAEIQFVRFHQGKLVEAQRFEITQPLSPLSGREHAPLEEVQLAVRKWSEDSPQAQPLEQRTFIVLSSETELGVESDAGESEGPPEYIRILLEVPEPDRISLKDEPLFLYYPIEASLSGVPFLIHGPFRVNSSRTALIPSQQDHNWQVLEEAIQLLGSSLEALLKPGSPLRKWLPWILLPLGDSEGEGSVGRRALQRKLIAGITQLLKNRSCVPTTHGIRRPNKVCFFPDRPDALVLFEELRVGRKKMSAQFTLLDQENRETYQRLCASDSARWTRAAQSIGLGQIGLLRLAQDLAEHMGRAAKGKPLTVDADQGRALFLTLCALLGEEEDEISHQAAKVLGQNGVPFLPAFAGPDADQEGEERLVLVPAEPRRETDAGTLRRAGRVVFWRPASVKARAGDLPTPPSTIPVYFIDPSVVEAEGARAEGILSKFYDEWGTTRFESRPDLFRRVADRAAQLSGGDTLPVLGYLAGVLHSIISESFSSADDLRPRPYATIDLDTLWNLLNVVSRSTRQRRLDRQRIESAHLWSQVRVPVRAGKQAKAPADSVVFGSEWADFLDQVAESDSEDEAQQRQAWAVAIRALISFRATVGRTADDPTCPEIVPPDDPRWKPVRQQLRRVVPTMTPKGETLALFHLLLLFGARIGPRVEWRWLNNVGQAEYFNPESHAINLKASRQLFKGDELPDEVFPCLLAEAKLMQAYRDYMSLKPYHPAFSGNHSWGCRDDMQRKGKVNSHLAAWTWMPDLMDTDINKPPFGGDMVAIDAFREALIAIWPELSKGALQTGWYCEGWHKGRSWKERVPSLAAFQLSRLELWPTQVSGRLANAEDRRFPASVMVAWDREESPRATNPSSFFPLINILDEQMSHIARDLEITTLTDLSFPGAVTRLRWLLEESSVGRGQSKYWQIAEFEGTSRDAWLAAQYRLLARIVHNDPDNLWDRRTVLTCGLALRAVQREDQRAVPVTTDFQGNPQFAQDVAFFSQPPRHWERQANAKRWILETQRQIQTALYRWGEALGATRLAPTDPPSYKGERVENLDAVATLHREVHERLALLLATFKAHRAEKLEEKAEQLIAGLDRMYPVEPDEQEKGWSGLGADGHLVFSIRAYQSEQEAGRSGAVVLAEGLALLAEQTTAVGDLQHALTAPQDQVERALHFRGVEMDEIIREVRSLSRERLHLLLKRVEWLIQALAETTSSPVSIPDWQTDGIAEDDWMTAVQELKSATGPLADQALTVIESAVSDLVPRSRIALLCTALDEELATRDAIALIRAVLVILCDANWPLEERGRFARAEHVALPTDLAQHQEACNACLNTAAVTALVDRLASGELDDADEIERELFVRGQTFRDTLQAPPTETGDSFLNRISLSLKIPVDFDPSDLLLLEWDEETWLALRQAFRETADLELVHLSKDLQDLRSLLERCLENGSLEPLRERSQRQQSERQVRIRTLVDKIRTGELSFDVAALSGFDATPPIGTKGLTSEVPEAGRGLGGASIGAITADQAVRGRLAELFVLEVCWRRFLGLDAGERVRVLDEIEIHRQDNPDNVPWGTAVAWRRLKRRLAKHRKALLACPDDPKASGELVKLFQDLIEVANERGPGFDVLDPFGVWGVSNDNPPSPCRVEIKAILPLDKSTNGHRVILSTNEFHRARQHPASYVLRLIYVPREYDSLGGVQWACDVPDPVNTLDLGEKIKLGVRSGVLPFIVRPPIDGE
jgi:hypothetical protein